MDKVYLLWDGTEDWGSNPKVKLHSIHSSKSGAEKQKEKQHMNGAFFYIEEEALRR